MSLLTLNQAAKAAKKSKSTLSDAINSGRLSAFRNDKNQWQINSDDLFRVYPQTGRKPNEKTEADSSQTNEETAILRQQVELLEQRVNDIKDERDDLRRRLNEEMDERRKLSALITKVFDDDVLPLSGILYLTLSQYNIFTILFKGMDVIMEYYPRCSNNSSNINATLYPILNTEIRNDLAKIGVLYDRLVTEKFKQVTNSILQDRSFEEITLYDIVKIAKRYSEWRTLL